MPHIILTWLIIFILSARAVISLVNDALMMVDIAIYNCFRCLRLPGSCFFLLQEPNTDDGLGAY